MNEQPRMDRRTAIKWMLTAYASATLGPQLLRANPVTHIAPPIGYGTDPILTKSYNPGDFWPLTLTDAQRRVVSTLCDIIIPADEVSPSASAVGVPDFIDEWVSAPYETNVHDRGVILGGLAWLDEEAQRRWGKTFTDASTEQRTAICDDICAVDKASPPMKKAAHFFARFRDLTAGGFYTTPEGMKDVGYTGNVPIGTFAGPSPELIKQLGLAADA